MTDTTILIVGTYDTKDDELTYMADVIRGQGGRVLTMDVSVLGDPAEPCDISKHDVAAAGGSSIKAAIATEDENQDQNRDNEEEEKNEQSDTEDAEEDEREDSREQQTNQADNENTEMTPEEARRILDALSDEEKRALSLKKQQMKREMRQGDDW